MKIERDVKGLRTERSYFGQNWTLLLERELWLMGFLLMF